MTSISLDPADKSTSGNGSTSLATRSASPDPDAPVQNAPPRPVPVVAIGASMGSITDLEAFVRCIPADSPLTLVACVQGADPAEVVQRLTGATALRLVLAEGTVALEPGTLAILPDGSASSVVDAPDMPLRMTRGADIGPPHSPTTLDGLLRSLAETIGPGAAAVILDGPGDTGSRGLVDVKERAGLTMAQAGTSGDSAPAHAIATGHVDLVDAPDRLALRLIDLIGGAPSLDPLVGGAVSMGPTDALARILRILHARSGHDFSLYKPTTLFRRVGRRLQVAGVDSLDAYAAHVEATPEESDALLRDLLISVTDFFRDPGAFDALARHVIPALFDGRGPGDTIRVWVAGCATGEEAYSLMMLLLEHADSLVDPPAVQVFATDIDTRALARARDGLYPAVIRASVSPARLQRFFEPVAGGFRIRPAVRERVLFASHSLIADPPFSRLDLVSCRNVLIYLSREVQARVFGAFHYALRPGGFLFLGTSEGPESATRAFREVDGRARIFARRTGGGTLPRLSYDGFRSAAERGPGAPSLSPGGLAERYAAHSLARHTPPRLLVDERGDVTHVYGRAGDYLRDREGPATQSAVTKIATTFRLDLRTALFRAFHHGEVIETRFQRVDVAGETRVTRLRVAPVEEVLGERLAEVVFVELDPESVEALGRAIPSAPPDDLATARLEDELARTADRLRSVIESQESTNEELRAANEELQSINEELRSATEELETSKEELQSINEELATVNEELRDSNAEFVRVNADLQNLIASTDIGTVFLDAELSVVRYTPQATRVFHLISSDIGRPLGHVAHRLVIEDLTALANGVLRTSAGQVLTVGTDDGRWMQVRLSPYRALDGRPSGVVVSTVDVTDLKAAQTAAESGRRQQTAVADLGRFALDASLGELIDEAVRTVADVLGVEMSKVLRFQPETDDFRVIAGMGWTPGAIGQACVPNEFETQAGFTFAHDGPVIVEDFAEETRFGRPELLAKHDVVSGMSVTIDVPGAAPFGVLGAHSRRARQFSEDDGEFFRSVAIVLGAALRREADAETIQGQIRVLDDVYRQAPVGLALLDLDLCVIRINDRLASAGGATRDAHEGEPLRVHHPQIADALEPVASEVLRTGAPVEDVEVRRALPGQPDSERIWYCSLAPQIGSDGALAGLHLAALDVTETVRAQEALAETRATLDRALEGGGLGVWTIDAQRGMVIYDLRSQAMLGLPEEVPTSDVFGHLHEGDRDRVQGEMRDAMALGEPFQSEHRHVRPDGSECWIAVWAHSRPDGGMDGLAFDITARRQAEQTIRTQLGEIEAYFESVPVGVAVLDREHRFVRVNSRMSDLFQIPTEAFPGRRAAELNPAYVDVHQAYVERVFQTGVPLVNVEMTAAASDDPELVRHWLVGFFPIPGEADTDRVSLVVQDVTPLKQAQAGLERLAEDLERRVRERTRQVRRLAADLTQAEQAERRRVAQVLHDDLQQILYAAQMRLQLLSRVDTLDRLPELTDAADALLTQAIETARTLAVDLSPPILMGEGLDRSLEWLALRMEDTHGLAVTLAVTGDTRVAPDVHALLFALVRELLFNVVKHSGVTAAEVSLHRDEDALEIVVLDQGRGFAMTSLPHRSDGGGFGLLSVRERLGHVGGQMSIESAPEEGTRVLIQVPVGPLLDPLSDAVGPLSLGGTEPA